MPAYGWSAAAAASRSRSAPQATRSRGARTGPAPGEGLAQGKIGMVLGALGDGGVAVRTSVHGDPELADQGRDEQGMGGDEARIGGQRPRRVYGLETCVDAVSSTPVVVAKEGLKRRAPGALRRFAGRPTTQTSHKPVVSWS